MVDPNTTISAAPVVTALQPYLDALVTAIVGAAIVWATALFNKWTGSHISADQINQVKLQAQKEAGILVAKSADNLASKIFTIDSPEVANAVKSIEAAIPKVIDAAGYKPTDLSKEILGAIGKFQAQTTIATPLPVVVSTKSGS